MRERMPELLAPAGGPPEFNAALAAGADAIYCGFGNTFNARRGAQSFSSATFGEACRRAHLAGARVYVTVNVAIRDDEMPNVLALVRRAWLLGADAFIVQDWGLLAQIRRLWPDVSCHLSTQANVHDARGVRWARERGVDRVTLSRELSMTEIAHIAREGVELESFCHGAICICYSGVCMMSSCAGDRSANRGTCAQPCRLPYDLVDAHGNVLSPPDRGRPLCPRDFYSFEDLPELANTGVRSLKVEGRLKGSDYLYAVIGAYRAQLDDLAAGVATSEAQADERRTRLKRAFNRDFTNAYLQGGADDDLMSYERSNNRGEVVGRVEDSRFLGSTKVRRGGKGGGRERLRTIRVAEVDILLNKSVGKGDLLEVRPVDDFSQFLTTHAGDDAQAGDTITCRVARVMDKGSVVRVIRSQRAMDEGARTSELEVPRKRTVSVRIRACLGEPFEVELATTDGTASAVARGFVVEAARTRAVTREDLVAHVGRMGATPFDPSSFLVEMDEGLGMGFSAVHAVRAQACGELERAILAPYATRMLDSAPSREELSGRVCAEAFWNVPASPQVCALVASPEAARAATDAGATRIYATADALTHGTWPSGVIALLDEVCREADHDRLDRWVRKGQSVAVGNVSELALARERGAAAEVRGCIPVHNGSCLVALQKEGAAGVWLSAELSLDEIACVTKAARVPVGLVVLGRTRAMTCEHCVLQVADRCVHDCAACGLRRQATFLKNDAGDLFPVRTDEQGRSRVYAARSLDLTPHVGELARAGISRFGVDCTLLDVAQTREAVARAVCAVEAWEQGRRPALRAAGSTTGHLFAPIG